MIETSRLTFRVAGADVAAFAPLTGAALPKIGPYDLSGTLGGSGSTWTVADLAAKMGGSDLAGQVTVALDGPQPRIDAALTSTMLTLADFGAAAARRQRPRARRPRPRRPRIRRTSSRKCHCSSMRSRAWTPR
ncbi:MAG: hypothetical protein FJX36_03460 [Alphaproteobacteria bacterium]|nr:hypothetical protein [Alphaproteobacteria bacterium]